MSITKTVYIGPHIVLPVNADTIGNQEFFDLAFNDRYLVLTIENKCHLVPNIRDKSFFNHYVKDDEWYSVDFDNIVAQTQKDKFENYILDSEREIICDKYGGFYILFGLLVWYS